MLFLVMKREVAGLQKCIKSAYGVFVQSRRFQPLIWYVAQQGSWGHATKKQREKLLELIRRLAEDDKEGVMAHKVLTLLWNLAQSEDVTTDIMDQALAAHIKILDYSCSQVCSQVCTNTLSIRQNTLGRSAVM